MEVLGDIMAGKMSMKSATNERGSQAKIWRYGDNTTVRSSLRIKFFHKQVNMVKIWLLSNLLEPSTMHDGWFKQLMKGW